VVGSFRKKCHFVATSCKLRLSRFSAQLKFQDRTECGKNKETQKKPKETKRRTKKNQGKTIKNKEKQGKTKKNKENPTKKMRKTEKTQ
jgi:hypothetical protein